MIVRLRGDIFTDITLLTDRPPAIAELVHVNRRWFRVINVLWAFAQTADGKPGAGVALVLQETTEPSKESWVQPV